MVGATSFWPDHTIFSSYQGLKSMAKMVCYWSQYRLRVKVTDKRQLNTVELTRKCYSNINEGGRKF